MYKKSVSLMLVFVMILSLSVNASAVPNDTNVSMEPYDSETLYNQLAQIGFTNDEMLELYRREANKTGVDIHLPDKLAESAGVEYVYSCSSGEMALLAAYKEGDVRYQDYTINFDDIARVCGWTGGGTGVAFIIAQVSKKEFIKAVVSSVGLGWVSAITSVAGVVFSELSRYNTGCTFTVKSVYRYDEDEGFAKWYMVDASHVFF
ncbi:hypothetical protein OBV_07980 [Oscillibacter valericigenes Sjm18-20]|nr:hypothetical protein OBV_07980 [Oscillibacter valericigenes Sjm18-20]